MGNAGSRAVKLGWSGMGNAAGLGEVGRGPRPFPHSPCASTSFPYGSSSFPAPVAFLLAPLPFFPMFPSLPPHPHLPFLSLLPLLAHPLSPIPSSPSFTFSPFRPFLFIPFSFPILFCPSPSFPSLSPCLSPSPFPSSPSLHLLPLCLSLLPLILLPLPSSPSSFPSSPSYHLLPLLPLHLPLHPSFPFPREGAGMVIQPCQASPSANLGAGMRGASCV